MIHSVSIRKNKVRFQYWDMWCWRKHISVFRWSPSFEFAGYKYAPPVQAWSPPAWIPCAIIICRGPKFNLYNSSRVVGICQYIYSTERSMSIVPVALREPSRLPTLLWCHSEFTWQMARNAIRSPLTPQTKSNPEKKTWPRDASRISTMCQDLFL